MRLLSFYFLATLFIPRCELISSILLLTFILNISLILLCDEEVLDESSLSKCSSLLCAVVSAGAVVSVGLSGGVPGGVDGVLTIFFILAFDGDSWKQGKKFKLKCFLILNKCCGREGGCEGRGWG